MQDTLQYLAWSVLTGFHCKVTMSFMLLGHKKNSHQAAGVLVSSVAEVVNTFNMAQLVGTQSGEPVS